MGRHAISRDTRARAISHNYLDLTTDGPLEDWVSQLVSVGATLVEMRQDPATFANPDTWAVLQDPEGNEFCVLNAESVTGLA